jgi:hypothetical protein
MLLIDINNMSKDYSNISDYIKYLGGYEVDPGDINTYNVLCKAQIYYSEQLHKKHIKYASLTISIDTNKKSIFNLARNLTR